MVERGDVVVEGGSDSGDPVAVFGEIHTGLLQHSTPLPVRDCEEVVSAFRGERVRSAERPIPRTVSPARLTGVDCELASTGGSARGVGCVTTVTSITGGRVLQAATVGRLVRSRGTHRRSWAHYLSSPGTIEVIGRAGPEALAAGHLSGVRRATTLDLDSITARALTAVQSNKSLDHNPPFRTGRTMLRWAALAGPTNRVRLALGLRQRRTALVTCASLEAVAEFCADLALHDWLLTSLTHLIGRSGIGEQRVRDRRNVVQRLAPAVDHLLHLWMPAARSESDAELWRRVDGYPALDRQWQLTVEQIRDQLALNTIELLTAARRWSTE
jgi:hypothetical protein